MYCTPSIANELGTPVTPELVLNSQRSLPDLASNARKFRSLVPPRKTSPPPVVRIGPQFWDGNLWVHTFWPVAMSHACSSPMWLAPSRQLMVVLGRSTPTKSLPGSYGDWTPAGVVRRFSLAGM